MCEHALTKQSHGKAMLNEYMHKQCSSRSAKLHFRSQHIYCPASGRCLFCHSIAICNHAITLMQRQSTLWAHSVSSSQCHELLHRQALPLEGLLQLICTVVLRWQSVDGICTFGIYSTCEKPCMTSTAVYQLITGGSQCELGLGKSQSTCACI